VANTGRYQSKSHICLTASQETENVALNAPYLRTYLGIFSSFTTVCEPKSFFRFAGFRTPGNFCMPTSKRCRFSGDVKAEERSLCKMSNRTSLKTVSGT